MTLFRALRSRGGEGRYPQGRKAEELLGERGREKGRRCRGDRAQQPEGVAGSELQGAARTCGLGGCGVSLIYGEQMRHELSEREFSRAKNLRVGTVFKKPPDM